MKSRKQREKKHGGEKSENEKEKEIGIDRKERLNEQKREWNL